ncbi:antibiotic biosynthesis monooxygenase [Stenomitos frigidus ULC18]|uniref:Antibiotic biosynthesis monooxygenase n=1 Tax=Stenomitos frigidus ULC18 TaxID=2107698 RepID=A0A2T1E0K2_9CYAN|nr:antibiotic biosynthesis monooxygenase [Stenomitos frigidus ULC18]
MPTIAKNKRFTVLVEWGVDSQYQQELIDAICDLIEQHIKSDIGFVSASFHASEDGRRVINYGQWHSKEDWSKFRSSGNDEATAAIAAVISRCGAKTLKVETFRVDRVIENI